MDFIFPVVVTSKAIQKKYKNFLFCVYKWCILGLYILIWVIDLAHQADNQK